MEFDLMAKRAISQNDLLMQKINWLFFVLMHEHTRIYSQCCILTKTPANSWINFRFIWKHPSAQIYVSRHGIIKCSNKITNIKWCENEKNKQNYCAHRIVSWKWHSSRNWNAEWLTTHNTQWHASTEVVSETNWMKIK